MTRLAFPFGPTSLGRTGTVSYGSDAHVHQMLELLIFTMAGERVMRPDLGSPVAQMLQKSGGGPAAMALQAALQATIVQWLGHVLALRDLSVEFDENEAALYVDVVYEVLSSKKSESKRFSKGLK